MHAGIRHRCIPGIGCYFFGCEALHKCNVAMHMDVNVVKLVMTSLPDFTSLMNPAFVPIDSLSFLYGPVVCYEIRERSNVFVNHRLPRAASKAAILFSVADTSFAVAVQVSRRLAASIENESLHG